MSGSRGTSVGSYSALQSGDGVGTFSFKIDDGNSFGVGGQLRVDAAATATNANTPGNLYLGTTQSGTNAPTEWIKLTSSGTFSIRDSTLADAANFVHDGTDFNTTFGGTTDWNITLATGSIVLTTAQNQGLQVTDGTVTGVLIPSSVSTNSLALYATSNHPLVFGTNNTHRMSITATGNVAIGTAALATTATDGFLYVPSCAGTPTGTPTTITGLAPIVVDSTNNKLYFYSNGSWRDAGP